MDSNDDESIYSTIAGSVLTPDDEPRNTRLEELLRHAGLSPPDPLVQLTRPNDYDLEAHVSDEHLSTARTFLLRARASDPGYREPDQEDGHLLTFTKHEVGKAFNSLYDLDALPDVRVAQAILSSVKNLHSLDELWEHFQFNRFRRSTSSSHGMANWLEIATRRGNTDYIRLICQLGIANMLLNDAFCVALERRDMYSARILVRFGASVDYTSRRFIRRRVQLGDIDVVKLLLAAPNGMNVKDWQYCLMEEIRATAKQKRTPRILLQCLDHDSRIASGQLLLEALKESNSAAVAVLLAYLATRRSVASAATACFLSTTGDPEEHEDIAMQACKCVSVIVDPQRRCRLYFLLNEVGLLRDGDSLRREMTLNVAERRFPIIRLLVNAGVRPPSIQAAVAEMDFSLMEILAYTKILLEEASSLVSFVPESTSEENMLRLLNIFSNASKNLKGPALDQSLVSAIEKKHRLVVEALLRMGASIAFESAAAIRLTLDAMDIEMLQALLQTGINREQLSPVLPVAMNITDAVIRRWAVQILAKKGVKTGSLVNALARAVHSSDPDLELIRIILKYKIPVHADSDGLNVFRLAIQQGNIAVIRLLCEAAPHAAPLSEAVLLAISQISKHDNVTYTIVELLLQHGARGPPLDRALTLVASSDRPRAQDTARLLINHGTDANHSQGSAYLAASAASNYSMLAVLCKACPLQPVSLKRLLSALFIASNFKAETLELVLESAVSISAATINEVCTPELLKESQHLASIIPCLLRHGLDINLHNGAVPRIAVEEQNISLVKIILSSSDLSNSSLGIAFKATDKVKPRDIQLDMMALLLDKARFVEIGQSDRLLDETIEALSVDGDQKGLQLLLRHKASVDADGGNALRIAAAMSVSSTAILKTLLSHRPNGSAVSKSCLAVLESRKLGEPQREVVLKILLGSKTGLKMADMRDLLHNSITRFGDSILLPKLLIAHRVKVRFRDLQAALAKSNKEVFQLLASNFKPYKSRQAFFFHTRMIPMKSDRRLWAYETMLNSWTIPGASISEALVSTLKDAGRTDIALPKLLLQYGAEVEFKALLPLKLSLKLKAGTEILELLLKHIKDGNAAVTAFQHVCASSALEPVSKLCLYRCLSKHNISKETLSQALIGTLEDGQDIATIQFLLAQGANPNEDGAKCFILACDDGNGVAFRAMCPYAEVDSVARALLGHFSQEKQVVKWLGMCMDTLTPAAAHIKDPKLLVQAMLNFPNGGALVERLLGYGVSAGELLNWSLCNHWAAEAVTPLIWALFQVHKVSNRILLALIARGQEAKPLYLTPKSQVSAAFACMLDPSRTPVLEALLEQDRDEIKTCVIPGRSFAYLGQKPRLPNSKDMIDHGLTLGTAALYLGNFQAYRALRCGEDADDGSLHTAALLALPNFVEWLLERHSADHPLEEFGMMIPLAVACSSKAPPWCSVANAEGTFEDRQRRTMQLHARRTDLSWRYRRKTVLHFAIDNGPDIVEAMLEALEVAKDPRRNQRYLYTDKQNIVYSPSMYISRLLDPENKSSESKKMITILQKKSYDFIIITTKALPDLTSSIIAEIKPLITPGKTSLALLQNGLAIEAPFAAAFPHTPIFSSVSMIGSRLTNRTSIYHQYPDLSKIGAHFHHVDDTFTRATQHDAAALYVEVYNAGLAAAKPKTNARCLLVNDIVGARWSKLLWSASFNTICTVLRIPVGELLSGPGRNTLLEPAMREVAAVATAAGYSNDVSEDMIQTMLHDSTPTSTSRPSMLVDLENHRPLELEVILGALLTVANGKGIRAPVLTQVYALLTQVQ